jgi:hypothetical protein
MFKALKTQIYPTPQQAERENFDAAYQHYFKESKGFPRFHSKHRDASLFTLKMNSAVNYGRTLSEATYKMPAQIIDVWAREKIAVNACN